ncbi:MAG TPA: Asp-tRNA(Asn)/Glu-tRNA(Gln) amidotransferase subunit GatA [Chloroflexia bacterium]|nr:Asp-tRNA(Asn)/Glu-tRNA(Gln) amidotransferase subunit GatA [Chloroflexia bacterium]
MSEQDLCYLSLTEVRALLDRGVVSSLELTEACLARIEEVDGDLHAFLTISADKAREQARAADARRAAGTVRGPLDGIPMSLKDILITAGIRTTAGSRILENFVPPWDGTVVSRLYGAGAVLLGKVNQDEFAMGSSTEHSAFGPTRNPWDRSRVPGGSSGGSAAAVAAGMGYFSLGTDTGGSIRQPAALCGVVGVKPTYGRVSRSGVVAFASSLDQIGPFARTTRDAALVLAAIAGQDPLDSTTQPVPVEDYAAGLTGDVRGLRVGVPREYALDTLPDAVRAAIEAAIRQLQTLGASVREVSLPHSEYALAAYYIIAPAEASANLARYDGVKYGLRAEGGTGAADGAGVDLMSRTRGAGFGPEVKRRIMLGTYGLSSGYYDAYYKKAQQVRTLVAQDFTRAFEEVDILVSPTSPTTAFRVGEVDDPLQMYLMDIYTIPANLAGICGVSVPCGFAGDLPIGLQLLGRPFAEGTVLRAAHAYEQSTAWHLRHPVLAGVSQPA